jgi:hypothetical protein
MCEACGGALAVQNSEQGGVSGFPLSSCAGALLVICEGICCCRRSDDSNVVRCSSLRSTPAQSATTDDHPDK